MNCIINTPGGNIGRVVTERLLEHEDARVTIISRNPERVADLIKRGAHLVRGSLDDHEVLKRAMQNGGSLFWLTPPPDRPDFLDWALRTARAAAEAAREGGINRIVNISSVGAHSGPGTGPVGIMQEIEQIFAFASHDLTSFRPAFFMDNYLASIATIASDGSINLPLPADKPYPMVATCDIGHRAADRLLDMDWDGHRIIGLHGPVDLTQERAAGIIGKAIGRKITYNQITLERMRAELLQMGIPDFVADLMVELYGAASDGRLDPAEPRTPDTTTPTTLARWAQQVLKPALGLQARGS